VLLEFKARLYDPSGALAGWRADANPCDADTTWGGVQCDGGGRIRGLALDSLGLRGPLYPGLAAIAGLKSITADGNYLTGARARACVWGVTGHRRRSLPRAARQNVPHTSHIH